MSQSDQPAGLARTGEDRMRPPDGYKRIRIPGMGSLLLRGSTWWIAYTVDGKERRESARQPRIGKEYDGSQAGARKLLKKRMAEIENHQYVAPDARRLTLADLKAEYLGHYARVGLRSEITAKCRVANLEEFFGGDRLSAITTQRIMTYQDFRLGRKASGATINRETAALARGFALLRKANRIPPTLIPQFPDRLEESGPREGFFEHADYLAVRQHLKAHYRRAVDFGYFVGWRRGAIQSLTWPSVDLHANTLRLPAELAKNKKMQNIVIPAPVREVLLEAWQNRRDGCPLVFHKNGKPLGDWRKAWATACDKAKLSQHRLFHDFRRTACRNLVRAGVPERVAMLITGHRTRSVFDRYCITSERDLREAGEKLVAYIEQQPKGATVTSIQPKARGGR